MLTPVTVYTKPRCKQCDLTKDVLESKGITFEVEDLREEGNLAAAKALGYMQAPVVVAGDKHWSGFRPDLIDELVKERGL